MLGTVPLRSLLPCSSGRLPEPADLPHRASNRSRRGIGVGSSIPVVCNAQKSSSSVPNLEPFSRSKIERLIPEPPFLQKTEDDLTEYCTRLEGDESYSCWRAYFELKDLENEMPREDVEKLVRQAGGVKSLIDCVHGVTAMQRKEESRRAAAAAQTTKGGGEATAVGGDPNGVVVRRRRDEACPIPDGLPPTQEELEEEEKARMPDSPYTRLLRSKGRTPAWFSHLPDHETD